MHCTRVHTYKHTMTHTHWDICSTSRNSTKSFQEGARDNTHSQTIRTIHKNYALSLWGSNSVPTELNTHSPPSLRLPTPITCTPLHTCCTVMIFTCTSCSLVRPPITNHWSLYMFTHCLAGLVVETSASRAEDQGFKSHLWRDFSRVESYQWIKNWHPSGSLPGAWRYRVSAGTGWPGVCIQWLGEVESWSCNFYLSVAACKNVWADPSLRYTSMLLGQQI